MLLQSMGIKVLITYNTQGLTIQQTYLLLSQS